LPGDGFARAKVAQWLSFEGNYVEPAIGTLRHWIMTGKVTRRPSELVESRRAASMKALGILDRELAVREFIVGDAYGIADISLFAYVSCAREAELPLDDFANIVAWTGRVEEQPGFLADVYPYSIDPHSSRELP
jgi:glutathione S-transferase